MKVVIDGFGGDNAPDEIVKGVAMALRERPELEVVITGNAEVLSPLVAECEDCDRIEIANASEVITNEDTPTKAIKAKKDSSLVVAYDLIANEDDIGALVSCGSTGATLAGAIMKLGRIKGVLRPTLLVCLPSDKGGAVVLADTGANVDSKPQFLLQYAKLANIYAKNVLKITSPRVGLLSNGAEDEKGNSLCKEAFPLLKQCEELNFYGNIEARDMLSGAVDIVVADGFDGNIALKCTEGTALMVLNKLKAAVNRGSILSKIGALLMKPVFKSLKKEMDYTEYGGAIILGVKKPVIKGHGSSKAKSVKYCLLQAADVIDGRVTETVYEQLGRNSDDNGND